MYFQGFSINQLLPLVPTIIAFGFSVFFFRKNKIKISLVMLFLGAFGTGCFMALLDPYLHVWDEQYHALVAKNLMDNPFFPVLYKNPILDYDYRVWTDNYVWLHKQPLFLWQMALSMKLFGVNEFSVRLPSIMMHAIIPLFIYRIGKISLNSKTGFLGGLLFSVAYFPLELISGKYGMDHNDLAFLFYITASFWAWFEYKYSNKNFWLILIGLFAGGAVLVKWLMGLLVFICWAFTFFSKGKELLNWRKYLPILKSFIISLLVFVPWQIYILSRFPAESRYEFSAFSDHLFSGVEGHGGSFWQHFQNTGILYGPGFLIPILIIPSLIILFRKLKVVNYRIFIIGAVLFVYLFYSIASTKMLAFCVIVSPLIFLSLSTLFVAVFDYFEKKIHLSFLKSLLIYVSIIVTSFYLMDFNDIRSNHTLSNPSKNDSRIEKLAEKALIDNLDNILPGKNYVIFNTHFVQGGNIPFMFYTDYTAHRFIPAKEQLAKVTSKGYKISILDFNDLPEYIRKDKDILIIPVKIDY